MPETTSYLNRFQNEAAAAAYESKEYGAESYSSFIWQWQRPVVEQLIREYRRQKNTPLRLLDFACGTGRVLACVEPLVDSADGIDISENMISLARAKCSKAQLKVGDILSQPELLQKNYDVITAFRFLLNVEPDIRRAVLRKLRSAARQPDSLLLVNVHGSSRSLRHPAIVWRRWRERSHPSGAMLNEMSPAETRTLLRECGFQVVQQFGFGVLPPTLYRTPLRGAAAMVDKSLAGDNLWRAGAIDMLFVCRPC